MLLSGSALTLLGPAMELSSRLYYSLELCQTFFHFFNDSAQSRNNLRGIQLLLDVPRLKYAEIHSEMVYFRKDRAGYL
jgi:hypothetical protein